MHFCLFFSPGGYLGELKNQPTSTYNPGKNKLADMLMLNSFSQQKIATEILSTNPAIY